MVKILLGGLCILSCLAQSRVSGTGFITGAVKGEDGSAIAGAQIALYLRSPQFLSARHVRTTWNTVTDAVATFRVEGLSQGEYRICVEVPESTWLNQCEWGIESAAFVSISAGQPTASIEVTLKRGVAVPIRIDDPDRLLSTHEGKTRGAHLMLGVANDARVFRSAKHVSQDVSGQDMHVIIPFNRAIKLVVYSSFFRLNYAGEELSRSVGRHIPLFVAAGAKAPPIILKIDGGV
jgi:hypothetical protein